VTRQGNARQDKTQHDTTRKTGGARKGKERKGREGKKREGKGREGKGDITVDPASLYAIPVQMDGVDEEYIQITTTLSNGSRYTLSQQSHISSCSPVIDPSRVREVEADIGGQKDPI
jgi:hypothetical protein